MHPISFDYADNDIFDADDSYRGKPPPPLRAG
jgi:hypothetical protein